MMDERGWGWTASEIRRAQLIEWIVPQSGDVFVPVRPFYEALPDQEANTFRWHTAISEILSAVPCSTLPLG